MKKILKIFVFLTIVAVLVYQFRSTLNKHFVVLQNDFGTLFLKAPCAEPIPYTINTFDPKFNISKIYFLSALSDAEAVWEKSQGKSFEKNLFIYTPENHTVNVLKINLVYDYRQEATAKLASLGIIVKDNKASYDELKAKFTALQTEYNVQQNAFDTRVAIFDQKKQVYQTEVNYWNSKGGAPQAEYDRLQTMRLELDSESKGLQITQTQINSIADEINALVVALNRLINTLNLSAAKYNTTTISRGESFEEGVYVSDGFNREIDIYEFSSREKLVRVLAHELGHALDLDHVDDPKAIMYKLNQGNNQVLTKTDLDALKIKCQIK